MPPQDAPAQLVTFAISHFCEIARWALDWHGIRYVERNWAPGPHVAAARRLGVPATTLPILIDRGVALQGSGRIVDWSDAHATDGAHRLTPPDTEAEHRAIERRAGRGIGVQVRRLIYAETLARHPEVVRPGLFQGAPPLQRLAGRVAWPLVRRLTMARFDAKPAAAPDARARIADELDWIAGLLADGRPFLTGSRFGRADIAVASLLAPLARPAEHALFATVPLPPALLRDVEGWSSTPAMRWVRALYRDVRHRTQRE